MSDEAGMVRGGQAGFDEATIVQPQTKQRLSIDLVSIWWSKNFEKGFACPLNVCKVR